MGACPACGAGDDTRGVVRCQRSRTARLISLASRELLPRRSQSSPIHDRPRSMTAPHFPSRRRHTASSPPDGPMSISLHWRDSGTRHDPWHAHCSRCASPVRRTVLLRVVGCGVVRAVSVTGLRSPFQVAGASASLETGFDLLSFLPSPSLGFAWLRLFFVSTQLPSELVSHAGLHVARTSQRWRARHGVLWRLRVVRSAGDRTQPMLRGMHGSARGVRTGSRLLRSLGVRRSRPCRRSLPTDAVAQAERARALARASRWTPTNRAQGVRVGHVVRGSPADKAGLREGDRIVARGAATASRAGRTSSTPSRAYAVGDTVDIAFVARGQGADRPASRSPRCPSQDDMLRMDLVGTFAPTWKDVESVSGTLPALDRRDARARRRCSTSGRRGARPAASSSPSSSALQARYGAQGLERPRASRPRTRRTSRLRAAHGHAVRASPSTSTAQTTRSYGVVEPADARGHRQARRRPRRGHRLRLVRGRAPRGQRAHAPAARETPAPRTSPEAAGLTSGMADPRALVRVLDELLWTLRRDGLRDLHGAGHRRRAGGRGGRSRATRPRSRGHRRRRRPARRRARRFDAALRRASSRPPRPGARGGTFWERLAARGFDARRARRACAQLLAQLAAPGHRTAADLGALLERGADLDRLLAQSGLARTIDAHSGLQLGFLTHRAARASSGARRARTDARRAAGRLADALGRPRRRPRRRPGAASSRARRTRSAPTCSRPTRRASASSTRERARARARDDAVRVPHRRRDRGGAPRGAPLRRAPPRRRPRPRAPRSPRAHRPPPDPPPRAAHRRRPLRSSRAKTTRPRPPQARPPVRRQRLGARRGRASSSSSPTPRRSSSSAPGPSSS